MKPVLMLSVLFAGCRCLVSPPSQDLLDQASGLTAFETSIQQGEKTLKNTETIIAALDRIEAASISSSVPDGKDVIASDSEAAEKMDSKPSTLPSSMSFPVRTASDGTKLVIDVSGNWNPHILETSLHLGREHGIDTNGMTHQEMADAHAKLHGRERTTGGPVLTGVMFQNNRKGEITSQRTSVRSLPQRVSFFGRAKYSTRQSCPSGRCPQR